MMASRNSCFITTASSQLSRSPTCFLQRGACLQRQRNPQITTRTVPAVRMSLPPASLTSNLSSVSLLVSDISDVNKGPLLATAFVFFLTFWGGISFVKGSTKPRITQASFTLRQPAADLAKSTARYLMERSFVADLEKDGRDGVVTFTGQVRASSSVASILVAVAASGIWSASYILNFILPENLRSPYWGLLTLLSFAVVPWYWKQANRTEEFKVMVEQEGDLSKLYVKGHRDEIASLESAFQWKRDEPVYEGDEETEGRNAKVKTPEAQTTEV
eukprot:GFKZ01007546.1.p1 GENE.GFKZ01007546.1~~GFKZ01007546.1.p1  ORF type:complete len:274 (+),score=27.64 GFKZ01007546.1:149-970(+)